MKKLLVFTNLAWVFVIMLLTVYGMKKPETSSQSLFASPDTCMSCTNDAFYGLTAREFLKGIARYRYYDLKGIEKTINPALQSTTFTDARSCWYSVDTLKKFICLLEQYSESKELGLAHKDLGIRFYYATYSSKQQMKIHNQEGLVQTVSVGAHHTLFMVPTYLNREVHYDLDFDPRISYLKAKADSGKPILVSPPLTAKFISPWLIYKKDSAASIFALDYLSANGYQNATPHDNSNVPSAKNQGMLCPPTCPTGTTSTMSEADNAFAIPDFNP